MIVDRRTRRAAVAAVTACGLFVSPIAPLLSAQTGSTPPARTAAAAREADGGWPRDYTTASGGAIRIFQPQVASWDGQRHLVAYAAVSYLAKGASTPALGTVKLEADTAVAVAERLVNFTSVKLAESNFGKLPNEQVREIVATIEKAVPSGALVIGLDRVLARLDKSQIMPKNVNGVTASVRRSTM